jgi:PhnB protein
MSEPPAGFPRILPHLIYDDVGAAIDWLSAAFGFSERTAMRHTDADGRVGRAQLGVGDSVITVGTPGVHGDSPRRGVCSMLYVYVDDVEAHYHRATRGGAKVVMPLEDRPWGDRLYQVTDLEGHHWTFAQHVRDVELEHEHLVAVTRP